ncbi:hypothetical protein TNCT_535321 [Trichonephila clavata]|uniref:Uncharacterized protein n=1 Tax=Trichonephila clavata TaxID=2740835 RepID=A0A8X6H899_TRICU|nr:hypothetical protein TNCT_535321 [Trichonephila clavata]
MKPQNPLENELAYYLLLRLVGYQSCLRPREDFHNMWPHLLGRSPRLVFLIFTAWRSTIRRRRSETACWDPPLVGLGVERGRKFGL